MGDLVRYPALTIWQPWATLIMEGCKPFEFRAWAAPPHLRGQRIAIHAGARPVRRDEVGTLILQLRREGAFGTALVVEPALELLQRIRLSPLSLPLSSVLGTAVLGTPIRAADLAGSCDSQRVDHSKWAWPLTEIEPFAFPIPARGLQGFWSWSSSQAAPIGPLFSEEKP